MKKSKDITHTVKGWPVGSRLKQSGRIEKRIFNQILCWLLFSLVASNIYAEEKESYCTNLGFELGNFTNWTGYTWYHSIDVTSINSSKVEGIMYRRQTIMTDTTAYDPNTGDELKLIPKGYKYSARLGDEIVSGTDANPRCWQQSLRYTMTIDSANALLVMKFACVLQYADDHSELMEPRFRVSLFDENGDTIPDCANYDVYSSSSEVKGFQTYTPSGSTDPVQWRDWTTVGANLLNYVGKTITIEFMSADCTGRYHYGYAYFVAACHPMSIAVKYCSGDSSAVLTAPEGFESYSWTNSAGTEVDTVQKIEVLNPSEGAVYSCKMISATGCEVTLQATIVRYEIKTGFDSYMLDCFSNKVQFTNSSTTTHGHLTYNWVFDDSTTSDVRSPQHTFPTSGMHLVSLELANPPSECTAILTKDVESFSPPLVGIGGDSTYCPNQTTVLKAYGAYQYSWSDGSVDDTLEVGAPGGTYWMLGHSSTGCVSDTAYITVGEEPGWKLSVEGDSSLCNGETSVLSAYGAASYLWSTGDAADSILVKASGTYTVTGANARGCKKSESFEVTVHPVPSVDFTLSASSVDIRHNQLKGNVDSPSDATYAWNMGDGLTETGTNIQHNYTIADGVLEYRIQLTGTNDTGCTDSSSQTIDVVPFIPNVFSPNGDGINEIFAFGLQLTVFDRNGTLFYKGNDGWDGTFNGRSADPDTYFYLIRYKDKDGQE